MPSILVLFSNPEDSDRLRLDREHRALSLLQEKHRQAGYAFDVLQATSRSDLAKALAQKSYQIVHFSGHGSDRGFWVERDDGEGGELISAESLGELLREFQPSLGLLLLMSCYSSAAVSTVVDTASYIVTASGSADDDAAMKFVRNFYDTYLEKGSIERAFSISNFIVGDELNCVLTRRAKVGASVKPFVALFSKKKIEPMYLDLSEAEESIKRLNIPREQVVATLGRKMHIHRWIFEEPRDRAVLTVGPYFGVFSWKSVSDVIVCHQMLRLRTGLPEKLIQTWAELIVTYNDLYMSEYRLLSTPVDSSTARTVARAIQEFKKAHARFFEGIEGAEWLADGDRSHFVAIGATLNANVEKAAEKLENQEYARSVIFLETALSSIHDFIDSLVERLADPD
ncbi:CHAT domain-containing protein [Paucibacter sp. B51]|uniref:CHAT domain-containing protein n=1 Tax=Paucibacter sp. B51 TaxID=2993315 RepID=UPI0022EBE44D|nr:CHAT domain-containing protein [Paucibacter sp. B51]